MVKRNQIFKCSVCGNTVILAAVGGGELVCCGKAMDLLEDITEGDKAPKHLPVIKKVDDGFIVNVGEVEHPMDEDHFIQLISLFTEDKIFTKILNPGDKPELVVKTDIEGPVSARALCNLHGLWANDL